MYSRAPRGSRASLAFKSDCVATPREGIPMSQRRMTFARLKEIYRRQDPPSWGRAYQPSIKATREEAPAISRAAQLWSEKLQRYVHALSSSEQAAVRLVLHHPHLFELQEQRMLPVEERPHPMTGHPRATGMDLPSLPGTIAVAQRLDFLKMHGWIRRLDPETSTDLLLPIPFLGDLLLFLFDDRGPYCVNWTIKQALEDFSRSVNLQRRVRDPSKDTVASRARHAIEEQLYFEAGIRTVRVVADSIPARLDANLRNLFVHQRCLNGLPPEAERELEGRVRASLTTGEPPQAVLLGVTHRHGVAYQDVRQTFYKLLWERKVRVELLDEVVLVDRPLKPERTDLLQRFAHLFNREA